MKNILFWWTYLLYSVSFVTHEKLRIGERLEIKMVLSTDLINLSVMASVVDCLSKNDNFQISDLNENE